MRTSALPTCCAGRRLLGKVLEGRRGCHFKLWVLFVGSAFKWLDAHIRHCGAYKMIFDQSQIEVLSKFLTTQLQILIKFCDNSEKFFDSLCFIPYGIGIVDGAASVSGKRFLYKDGDDYQHALLVDSFYVSLNSIESLDMMDFLIHKSITDVGDGNIDNAEDISHAIATFYHSFVVRSLSNNFGSFYKLMQLGGQDFVDFSKTKEPQLERIINFCRSL